MLLMEQMLPHLVQQQPGSNAAVAAAVANFRMLSQLARPVPILQHPHFQPVHPRPVKMCGSFGDPISASHHHFPFSMLADNFAPDRNHCDRGGIFTPVLTSPYDRDYDDKGENCGSDPKTNRSN